MSNLIKKVQNTIFQHNLFSRGDKILLAVSGGPDSSAMLDIFSRLKNKYDLQLAIAHMNYGLRGRDSDRDERFVRELAEKYGIEIFVLHHNRPAGNAHEHSRNAYMRSLQKQPSENILRDIRYDFFEKIRRENNFDQIAVAHNMDDQVETFLMRVIRGAGLKGLASMKYKNKNIIRPLLNVSRKEILQYLKNHKLKFRTDKTNLESKYLRNKIRNKLIPYLEKNFNPQIKKTIFGGVENISEDYSYIYKETKRIFDKNHLSVKKINNLHPAIRKRVLLMAISKIQGPQNIESAHINEILKITDSKKNKRQVMKFKGLKVERRGDKLKIEKILDN